MAVKQRELVPGRFYWTGFRSCAEGFYADSGYFYQLEYNWQDIDGERVHGLWRNGKVFLRLGVIGEWVHRYIAETLTEARVQVVHWMLDEACNKLQNLAGRIGTVYGLVDRIVEERHA